MMTELRFECPQCGMRVGVIVAPETPMCKGPPEKRHLRPVKMVPTKAAPRKARQTRTATKKTTPARRTGMIKRRQR